MTSPPDIFAVFDLYGVFAPFFALVLMGWLAARTGLLALDGIGALNTFVLFFGLPAMVFRLAAGGALLQAGLPGLMLAYGAGGTVVLALALLRAHLAGLTRRDGSMLALATAFPNTGFLGLPLLTALLGEQAAGPVAATLLIDILLFSSVCLAWAHSGLAAGRTLTGALRNPLLWSMAAGLTVSWLGWRAPAVVDDTLRLLSAAASPAALFTLGAMLVRAQRSSNKSSAQQARSVASWPSVLLKLLVHPALVWLAGHALQQAGWPLPNVGLLALTLAAALPSASNVSMLAEREGADTALVARLILWSTGLALVSMPVWVHQLR